MKKYLAIAGIVAFALGVSSTYTEKSPLETQVEYILQGANKATIIENVDNVGGIIVHEYSVIDAVSVKLSISQLNELKILNPMLRSFKGQEVNVSSVIESFSSDNVSFNLKKKTATWKGVNSSNDTVVINAINLNMPNKNKKIKSVKINGKKISAKKIQLNDSIVLSASEQIEIGAGQAIKVKIKFAKINTVAASDYQVSFGESIQNENAAEQPSIANDAETVAGKVVFHADSNEVSWKVSNTASHIRELEQLNVSFPSQNAAIHSVRINKTDVSYVLNDDNGVVLSQPFEIVAHKVIDIRVGFDTLSSAFSDEYALSVQYIDGLAENVIVPSNSHEEGAQRDTNYPTLVNANLAHERGYTGYGVTVAILDTGIRDLTEIKKTTNGEDRNITIIDVLDTSNNRGKAKRNDFNGHGTHLASIITNSSQTVDANGDITGSYNGIAPDVNLVVMKAFDEEGQSSYTAILAALDYVVENKDVHNIKVLNLSFSAIPSSYYWDDPLNQALMRAWEAGITVIAAAGNRGPEAMTIGVPGNTPYVITVGAVSDNYTPSNLNDDFVTTFSSAGPTYEGFVKPELVAPGGHIAGVMDKDTLIRETYALYNDKDKDAHNYFELSGSSQSTAVTSGIVALMLQANPSLSPDDIKCRLIETAKAATTETGE
jgi:subtilisin family serine protease